MSSDLALVILIDPRVFATRVDELLLTLSEKLRASVRVKKTAENETEAFEWSEKDGAGKRIIFKSDTVRKQS